MTAHHADRPSGLAASLKSRHVSMIAIGGIIGAGLFVGSSTSISQIGPAVLVSYAMAGTVILLVMRMLSEMASRHPGAGSFTELVRLGLGDRAGFVCGWLYWYFWVVVVAIEAIAGAVIIHGWIPAMPVWLIGSVLLAGLTGVNLLSAKSYGEFEFWLSLTKVGAIIGFILVAGAWAFGLTSPNGPTFGNLVAHGGFAPKGWGAAIAGVTSVIFALCGAEIATVAAAEAHEPAKVIAKLTASIATRILLFYVLSIGLIVSVMPWNAVKAGVSPFAQALDAMHIPHAADLMNLLVLVAVTSCLNSGMYVSSRVLYVLADKGDAPRALAPLSRSAVPVRSTLIASAFAYAALAASVLSPELVFSYLVNASGALMIFIYMFVCLSQLAMRRRAGTQGATILMWWHPYGAWVTFAAMGAVLAAMAFRPGSRVELVSSLVVLGIALAGSFAGRDRSNHAMAARTSG
ncbi:amino acid permease [Novosphingobium cyanobacteriorum]|uniref:Amino acid permease n=1 Tax=Novosphingobium cyanobacteriorum TaxID=3024215 RepID=A0ABT6CLD9_9SPHN|nr:amino acid permease [Novosphingobium cyanobacteriorum]MDF8334735.1 amino acid permease [Novosphingobium cyanobacteriorum]